MIYTVVLLLRRWLKDLIVIVILSSLIVSFYVFYTNIHPSKSDDDRTPDTFKLSYENVSFNSTDDVALKGWFIRAANALPEEHMPTLLVLHGLGLSKAHALDWSYFLADDYNLFLFDFRGQGASSGDVTTLGNKETKDVLGAIEYLKTRPDVDQTKLGVYGYSLGASTGIMTAAITADIKVIIADSPYSSLTKEVEHLYEKYWIFQKPLAWLTGIWAQLFIQTNPKKVAPADSIKYTTAASLIMAPENDSAHLSESAWEIHNNAVSPNTEIWTVPGSHLSLFVGQREEYMERVENFLKTYLSQE